MALVVDHFDCVTLLGIITITDLLKELFGVRSLYPYFNYYLYYLFIVYYEKQEIFTNNNVRTAIEHKGKDVHFCIQPSESGESAQ